MRTMQMQILLEKSLQINYIPLGTLILLYLRKQGDDSLSQFEGLPVKLYVPDISAICPCRHGNAKEISHTYMILVLTKTVLFLLAPSTNVNAERIPSIV